MRQMTLVGFLQAQNCTNLASSWRHPQSRTDTWSPDYYRHIGRVLEDGKFHLGFFDDRLSMPDMYGRDHAHTVEHGIRCVKLDAVTVLTVMGMATQAARPRRHLFDDLLRAVPRRARVPDARPDDRRPRAWNVVTSLNDGEAQNMGRDEVIEHDLRYDRADEFMEVVLGHWDAWEDDAIVQDKASGLFAHPDKVHRLDHQGRFFRSRGPFTVPRSAQGHPVIIQAGQSGRGQRFGARWGEVIFVVYPNIEVGKRDYAAFKAEVAALGRDPEHVKVTQLVNPVAAATKPRPRTRWAEIDKLPLEIDALSLLSEALNFDFATKGMDEPFTDDELAEMSGLQGIRDRVLRGERQEEPDGARVHPDQRPRPRARSDGRRPEGGRRPARGMVRRARLRRLRRVGDPRAGRLRGFRALRGARAAAPRPVPQGLRRHDPARESSACRCRRCATGGACLRRRGD